MTPPGLVQVLEQKADGIKQYTVDISKAFLLFNKNNRKGKSHRNFAQQFVNGRANIADKV